jgi:hypothetical protein
LKLDLTTTFTSSLDLEKILRIKDDYGKKEELKAAFRFAFT